MQQELYEEDLIKLFSGIVGDGCGASKAPAIFNSELKTNQIEVITIEDMIAARTMVTKRS